MCSYHWLSALFFLSMTEYEIFYLNFHESDKADLKPASIVFTIASRCHLVVSLCVFAACSVHTAAYSKRGLSSIRCRTQTQQKKKRRKYWRLDTVDFICHVDNFHNNTERVNRVPQSIIDLYGWRGVSTSRDDVHKCYCAGREKKSDTNQTASIQCQMDQNQCKSLSTGGTTTNPTILDFTFVAKPAI